MRKLILTALFVSSCAFAQVTWVHQPKLDSELTYNSAHVHWETNPAINTQVECGTSSGSYTISVDRSDSQAGLHKYHSFYITGLAASTHYYCRAGGSTSTTQGCVAGTTAASCSYSDEFEFTTVARPTNEETVFKPEAPEEEVDTTIPTVANEDEYHPTNSPSGRIMTVDADCGNLGHSDADTGTIMDWLDGLSGSANYEVRIPADTYCMGRYKFPARPSHTGWVTVRTGSDDDTLAPPGVRTGPDFAANMARFVTATVPVPNGGGYGSLAQMQATCTPGNLHFAHTLATNGTLPILECTSMTDNVAKTVTAVSNTTPVRVTVTNHGYQTGNIVRALSLERVSNDTRWMVTRIDANTFSLHGSTPSGTAFDGSGTVTRLNGYKQPTFTSGTGAPSGGSPSQGDWYFQTDADTVQWSAWRYVDGRWWNYEGFNNVVGDETHGAIHFERAAEKYRFINLEVSHIPVPYPYPSTWDTTTSNQQELFGPLVSSPSGADTAADGELLSDIILDRLYIHGQGFPSKIIGGVWLNGNDTAIIDSYIAEIHIGVNDDFNGNWEAYPISIRHCYTCLIENNFISGFGINVFFPDTGNITAAIEENHDGIIRRNHFHKPEFGLYNRAANQVTGKGGGNNRVFYNRHHLEWKRGKRFLVEGNIFDKTHTYVNNGEAIAISPVSPPVSGETSSSLLPSAITSATNSVLTMANSNMFLEGMVIHIDSSSTSAYNGYWEVASSNATTVTLLDGPTASCAASCGDAWIAKSRFETSDLDIRWNTFQHLVGAVSLFGHHNYSGSFGVLTPQSKRIRFNDNLLINMNGKSYVNGGLVSSAPDGATISGTDAKTARIMGPYYGAAGLSIENNTAIDACGDGASILYSSPTIGVNTDLRIRANIFLIQATSGCSSPRPIDHARSSVGTTALNQMWLAGAAPAWEVSDNVICCGLSSQAASYPSGNFWPANAAAIGLKKYQTDDWNNQLDGLTTVYRDIDYSLASTSAYLGGSDGSTGPRRRPGVNMKKLAAKQGLVENVRAHSVDTTTASIGYVAPDATTACTVEYGTSEDWGTGTRVTDTPTKRSRRVDLTGLTTGTQYYYRVMCGVPDPHTLQHPNGTFTTD